MNKAYRTEPLNKQATVLLDAETDIKLTIKGGVLNGMSSFLIKEKIRKIIERALSKIKSETLKEDARKSLMQFADKTYAQMRRAFPNPLIAVAIWKAVQAVETSIVNGKTLPTAEMYIPRTNAEKTAFKTIYGGRFETDAKGIPLQEFQKEYVKKVSDALNDLASARGIDPSDMEGRNSLRNLAEMQVRYERHQEEISELKANGVKLVICSAHADCSERCAPYQGRLYSLDGTYGKAEDGRKYEPLENATQNPRDTYTTKAGRVYQNGLLGFNCRHYLTPYKSGMVAPYVSASVQKKEREITRRQRELERKVIKWRERAVLQKGNERAYKAAKKKAKYWFEQYKAYSKKNGRAYYPDRIKIL